MADNCKCCSFTKWENPVHSGAIYLALSFTLLYAMFCPECNPTACLGNSLILFFIGVKCVSALGFLPPSDKSDLIPSSWFEGDLFEDLYTSLNDTVGKFHSMATTGKAPVLAGALFGVMVLGELVGTMGVVFWMVQGVFAAGAVKTFAGIDITSRICAYSRLIEDQVHAVLAIVPRATSVSKKE